MIFTIIIGAEHETDDIVRDLSLNTVSYIFKIFNDNIFQDLYTYISDNSDNRLC